MNAVALVPRPQEDILKRIELRKQEDMFGFEVPYYVSALTYENAKPFLNDGVTEAEWSQQSLDDIKLQAVEYMAFAWEKANDCRGISANRSIMHYQAWLWLLGQEWGDSLMDDYEFYGKPQLIKICEFLGLDPAKWDDGERVN